MADREFGRLDRFRGRRPQARRPDNNHATHRTTIVSKQETIRRQVAEAYAKAVGEPDERSCCGGAEQRHVVTKLGGYSSEELQALPADAVINSFGCGNPVAFAEEGRPRRKGHRHRHDRQDDRPRAGEHQRFRPG